MGSAAQQPELLRRLEEGGVGSAVTQLASRLTQLPGGDHANGCGRPRTPDGWPAPCRERGEIIQAGAHGQVLDGSECK